MKTLLFCVRRTETHLRLLLPDPFDKVIELLRHDYGAVSHVEWLSAKKNVGKDEYEGVSE